MDDYYYERETGLPVGEAVDRLQGLLKDEGFGVLTEIDVQRTMREKLGKAMPPYVILGACHPASAAAVLEADPHIGTLLPCNVVAYEDGQGKVHVAAVRPTVLLSRGPAGVEGIALEVEERLRRAVDGV